MQTTSWLDYIQSDGAFRYQIDREAAQHRETLQAIHAQTAVLQDIAVIGVEQVKGLATVASGVEGIRSDMLALGALFDWRLEQILDQFQVQNEKFETIQLTLSNPLDTQAQELWRMAQKAVERDLDDEAIDFCKKVIEKSRLFYPAYLQLGYLYAYRKFDFEAAKRSFALAARYAEKVDPGSAAQALYQLYKFAREADESEEAWKLIEKASVLDPRLGPVWWDRATLALELRQNEEVAKSLRRAIEEDPLYWHRAEAQDWGPFQSKVVELLNRLKNEATEMALWDSSVLEQQVAEVEGKLPAIKARLDRQTQQQLDALRENLIRISEGSRSHLYAVLVSSMAASAAERSRLSERYAPLRQYVQRRIASIESETLALAEQAKEKEERARDQIGRTRYKFELVMSTILIGVVLLVAIVRAGGEKLSEGFGASGVVIFLCLLLAGGLGIYFWRRIRQHRQAEELLSNTTETYKKKRYALEREQRSLQELAQVIAAVMSGRSKKQRPSGPIVADVVPQGLDGLRITPFQQ